MTEATMRLQERFGQLENAKRRVETLEDELDTLLTPVMDAYPDRWQHCMTCYWIPDHADDTKLYVRVKCGRRCHVPSDDHGTFGIPWSFVDNMGEEALTSG